MELVSLIPYIIDIIPLYPMQSASYYTAKGLQNLQDKLAKLRAQRPEWIAAIAEARSHGDISENAELDEAKREQLHLERQIFTLEQELANARLLEEKAPAGSDRVTILSKVTVRNLTSGHILNYTLAGAQETDSRAGKISVDTPIARSLLGKKKGEQAEVHAPLGTFTLEILEVAPAA